MNYSDNRRLSVVLPAYNEGAGIQAAIRTLAAVLETLPYEFELMVVDDGSRDDTYERAAEMAEAGFPVCAIRLSRNFGKEAALLAGLQHARGDAVITIDADLQHPPALIPLMVEEWKRGAKVVNGVKRDRGDKHWWVTARAKIVNTLIERMGGIDVQNSSDFKLLDRSAVTIVTRQLRERNRFYRGLTRWIGLPQVTLEFDVAPRQQGTSGFSLRSLIALALTATISFTSAPLRIVSVLGLLTFLIGFIVGSEALWSWAHGAAVSGFMTIVATLLMLGSFIMISLGIIGEYIAKIYDETKGRPSYIVGGMRENVRWNAGADRGTIGSDVPIGTGVIEAIVGQRPSHDPMLEETHDAVIIWEMGGRGILYWNRAAEELYGYSREDAWGKTTHALLKTQLAGGISRLENSVARFGLWIGELRHTTRDGRELHVEGRLALLSQHNGHWLVLEVNCNATDRRGVEDAQEAMARQLSALQALRVPPADA